jgi:hypothetical protein
LPFDRLFVLDRAALARPLLLVMSHHDNGTRQRCVLLGDIIDILTPEQRQQLDAIAETLLRSLVLAAADADHICRLCDTQALRRGRAREDDPVIEVRVTRVGDHRRAFRNVWSWVLRKCRHPIR